MATERTDNDKIAFVIAIVITGAWTISFLTQIVVTEYDPPASVHALMMIVAGAVFGEGLFRSRRENGNGGNKTSKEKEDA